MKQVYLVLENHSSMMGTIIVKAFDTKEKADKFAAKMQKKEKHKPEYDDWGLCEGTEYIVVKLKVS